MSSKYRLISDAMYQRLVSAAVNKTEQQQEPASSAPPPPEPQQQQQPLGDDMDIQLVREQTPVDNDQSQRRTVLQLLPKSLRGRAESVLNVLGGRLQLETDTLCWKHADLGTHNGSHIVDLLRWTLSSPAIARNLHRPLDGPMFLRFLLDSGIPPTLVRSQLSRYGKEPVRRQAMRQKQTAVQRGKKKKNWIRY